MKNILIIALVLLFALAINTRKVAPPKVVPTQVPKQAKCVPINCVRRGPKEKVYITKACRKVRVGKCQVRTRCCKRVKKCLFSAFCKQQKKRCFWAGKVKKTKCVRRPRKHPRRPRKQPRRPRKHPRRPRKHPRRPRKHPRRPRKHPRRPRKHPRRPRKHPRRPRKHPRRPTLRRNQVQCQMYADPHMQAFNKKFFEAQVAGDWVLYRGENLAGHYRGKSFRTWFGAIAFGIRLFHHRIYTTGFSFDTLKIDGKKTKIPNGKTKLGKGTISRHNNRITFSTNRGEEIDLVSYGWFFNAFVRTRVVKVTGLCSHRFIRSKFFNHPQVFPIKRIKLPKCPRRKHFMKQCRKYRLSKGAFKNCVTDRCAGLKKSIEKKIIKRNKKEKKKVVKVPKKRIHKVRRITCSLYADPHVHGFTKKYFEAQTVGDWVLYRGENLAAHYRGVSFGSWVGPKKFGIRLYKNKIYSTGFSFEKLKINGRIRNIPNGLLKLKRGGRIFRNGNKITFSTNHGEEVDFIAYRWAHTYFYNAYVRSNVPKITGICSQRFIRSHFFKHEKRGKLIKVTKKKCPKRKIYRRKCKVLGLTGRKLKFCVRDRCNGLTKKIEKQIIKDNKKEDKVKIVKVIKRVHRITCSLYADPHVHGYGNQYFEAQTVGDWVLYRGLHLAAHYRGVSFGSWVGPMKFGVRLFHNRIFSTGFSFDKLKINGEIRQIPNGRTNIGERGTIIRNNNKITFSTNDGEEVDFISYRWANRHFYNAYVRSNVPDVTGICSRKFIRSHFFNHEQTGKKIVVEHKPCPNKQRYERSCKNKGLSGKRLKFCVTDLCNGLTKEIEKQIIKDNKKEDKKEVIVARVNRRHICALEADPHALAFSGRRFEFQVEGDYLLYKGHHLSVYYRGKRVGSWVAQILYGLRLKGTKIVSNGFSVQNIIINGVSRTLNQGSNELPNGATARIAGNKITFSTNDGEEVDFISGGYFFNAYFRSNVKSISGMCNQEFIRTSFFPHPQQGHVDNFHIANCPNKEQFMATCQRQNLIGLRLRNCVFDLCNGMKKRVVKKIIRQERREVRHPRVVAPPRVVPRPQPPRFVPRPPVRRMVFRRRARGDVWMQARNGKFYDVNDRGTFLYLEDSKIGLKIKTQFTADGKGTVISSLAIEARGKTIVAESDGTVQVNGETIKRKGAAFDFSNNKFVIRKFQKGKYEVVGLKRDRLAFNYDKDTQAYEIEVGTVESHHVGLYADPQHPRKYQISEEESPFEEYVRFKFVRPLKATAKQLKEAKECCKKLAGEKHKECVSDYVRVGKCLHYYNEEPEF